MSFYTNVNLIGNNLLYIGYENGQRIQRKFKFSPTLYVVSNQITEYKTLDGRYAKPIRFDTVGQARDFKDKYKDVENFEVQVMIGSYISIFLKSSPTKLSTISRLSRLHHLILKSHVRMAFLTYVNVRNNYWRSQYKTIRAVNLKYSQLGIITTPVRMLSLSIATMKNICYSAFLLTGRLTSQMFLQGGMLSCMTYLISVVVLNVYSGKKN